MRYIKEDISTQDRKGAMVKSAFTVYAFCPIRPCVYQWVEYVGRNRYSDWCTADDVHVTRIIAHSHAGAHEVVDISRGDQHVCHECKAHVGPRCIRIRPLWLTHWFEHFDVHCPLQLAVNHAIRNFNYQSLKSHVFADTCVRLYNIEHAPLDHVPIGHVKHQCRVNREICNFQLGNLRRIPANRIVRDDTAREWALVYTHCPEPVRIELAGINVTDNALVQIAHNVNRINRMLSSDGGGSARELYGCKLESMIQIERSIVLSHECIAFYPAWGIHGISIFLDSVVYPPWSMHGIPQSCVRVIRDSRRVLSVTINLTSCWARPLYHPNGALDLSRLRHELGRHYGSQMPLIKHICNYDKSRLRLQTRNRYVPGPKSPPLRILFLALYAELAILLSRKKTMSIQEATEAVCNHARQHSYDDTIALWIFHLLREEELFMSVINDKERIQIGGRHFSYAVMSTLNLDPQYKKK